MSTNVRLLPNQPVPPLRVKTVGGPCWRLCDQKPQHFTLVLFYRGLHCPFCKDVLQAYEAHYEEFRKLGVRVLAVSADNCEQAEQAVADWDLDELTVCWGLTRDQAEAWGLYITDGSDEMLDDASVPAWFVEPALFFIKPDNTLFASAVQTMPVGQPRMQDILDGIRYAIENGVLPTGGAGGKPVEPVDNGCGCDEPIPLKASRAAC